MKRIYTLFLMSLCVLQTSFSQTHIFTPRVGIGTYSPNRALTIQDNEGINIVSSIGGNLNLNYLYGNDAATIYALSSSGGVAKLSLNPDGGRVGIGTLNPNRALTVQHNEGLNVISSSGAYVNLNYVYNNSVPALYSLNSVGQIAPLLINPEGGNVGIGTMAATDKLTVAGKINSREVRVALDAGADFVFADDYRLPSLAETEKFIKTHRHLPEIAPAEKMVKDGIDLGAMNIKLLQKIEELTLHLIEQNKRIDRQQEEIVVLNSKIK